MSLNANQLTEWVPIRIYWQEQRPVVDWCWIGERRLTAPFFDQSIDDCLRLPFSSLFRPQTSIEVLGEKHALGPGVPPRGFIFHMSRCGSTLVSRMLAAQPKNVVLSEAGPVDSVLRSKFKDSRLTDEDRSEWLRWIVSALGQQRAGDERSLFIKFDCWSALDMPLIHKSFPHVPWIFLYRNPVEVLVSQLARRGAHMIPGAIEPALFGMRLDEVFTMQPEEYCARVLARVCEAAIGYHRDHPGMMINYEQLPDVVWTEILSFFAVDEADADIETLKQAATFNAKNPAVTFAADPNRKRGAASDAVNRAAAKWLDPLYEQLEGIRTSGS